MAGRVANKVAIVVGGGQTPGETIGNGRATALVLAREGAKVVVADRDLASAEETVGLIRQEGGGHRGPGGCDAARASAPAHWASSTACWWRNMRAGPDGRQERSRIPLPPWSRTAASSPLAIREVQDGRRGWRARRSASAYPAGRLTGVPAGDHQRGACA